MAHSAPISAYTSNNDHWWPMRLWLAAPDWVFRMMGFGFFATFIGYSAQKYWQHDLSELGPWCDIPRVGVIRMWWAPVLVDLTYLLIAISFIVRFNPRRRASNGWIIFFALLTAFAPFIFVYWLPWGLGQFDPTWNNAYIKFLWRDVITWQTAFAGGLLISLGNVLDVWGYAVLCRSFGIVPEARELKTTGPYRWVRHPVYLGQFLAQGGVWLFFARAHLVWIGVYVAFVAMQLYRSKLEERALAASFGDEYEQYRQRTFWFV